MRPNKNNRTITIEQWAAEPGTVRYKAPIVAHGWNPSSCLMTRYIEHLRVLAIDDPTKATAHFKHAVTLKRLAIHAPPGPAPVDLVRRLADEALTPDEAASALATTPNAEALRRHVSQTRRLYINSAHVTYTRAIRSIHEHGEEGWLGILRPLVADAVADRDQARWDALHAFAAFLRTPDIAGLSIFASDSGGRRSVPWYRYAFRRPDLCHFWRLARAKRSHAIATEFVGETVFVASAVTSAPVPKLEDVDPSWGPGLYSAADSLANADAVLTEQQQAHFTAAGPEEEDGQQRRRVVILV